MVAQTTLLHQEQKIIERAVALMNIEAVAKNFGG